MTFLAAVMLVCMILRLRVCSSASSCICTCFCPCIRLSVCQGLAEAVPLQTKICESSIACTDRVPNLHSDLQARTCQSASFCLAG